MWWLHNKTLLGDKVDHLLTNREKQEKKEPLRMEESRRRSEGDEVVLKRERELSLRELCGGDGTR